MRFSDRPDFKPDFSPIQMFKKGVFGGTYFRPIYSGVAGRNVAKPSAKVVNYLKGVDNRLIYSSTCDVKLNKHLSKTGQSLKEWERKGWIHPTQSNSDYYGFVGWYCEFVLGRRIPAIDNVQIKRFNSVRSRFGGMYKTHRTDKLKQLLLQWGIDYSKL